MRDTENDDVTKQEIGKAPCMMCERHRECCNETGDRKSTMCSKERDVTKWVTGQVSCTVEAGCRRASVITVAVTAY